PDEVAEATAARVEQAVGAVGRNRHGQRGERPGLGDADRYRIDGGPALGRPETLLQPLPHRARRRERDPLETPAVDLASAGWSGALHETSLSCAASIPARAT